MLYKFTDPEKHIDFGLGVLASDFRNAAEFLWVENEKGITNRLLPNLFLYRHSIELYLKSLIIIIHKKMELNYKDGTVPFDSKNAYVKYVDSNKKVKWRKLTTSHFISTLYNYFEELIIKHENKLREISSQKMSQIIDPNNRKIVNYIAQYDDKSTYFRYVDLNKEEWEEKEKEKKYNKKISPEYFNLEENNPKTALLLVNNADEVVEIHQSSREIPLKELSECLQSLSHYLSGIHIMFRTCLCFGY